MEKRILVLLCFISIGISQICYAQKNKIDSLLQVLKTAKEDTNKVIILNNLAWELKFQNPDTSILLSTQALQLAEKGQWKTGMATSYHQLGEFNFLKEDYVLALENDNKALALWEELNDKQGKAMTLGSMGSVYDEQADYPKALDYFFKALKLFEELEDKEGTAIELSDIGISYYHQLEYSKALNFHFKALKMDEELGDKQRVAADLNNIGNCYNGQGDYTQALEYFFRALKINEETGNKTWEAYNLMNIGNAYDYQGDSAFAKGNKTFAMSDKYRKALDYYFKALKISEELEDKYGIETVLSSMGPLYTKTGKFTEAEECLKKAIAIDEDIGALDYLRANEESISQLYDTTGRYKMALEHYKKAMVIKDTLFNQEKNKEITRKEMNYEFDKKEAAAKAEQDKKNAIAQQQIRRQKILKYSFIVGLGLVIVLLLFGYRVYRTRQVLRLQEIRNKIAGDLHDDIGSTLNSISIFSQVAEQDPAEQKHALQMIGEASRKIIESMSDIVWTINSDNDSFSKIIFRMRSFAFNLLRAKNIEFTFRAEESLNEKKLSMEARRNFYLIFKEALNNVVKYAEATFVTIDLKETKASLDLFISDNGKGFDMSQISPGNGLNNMKRRAKEMKADLRIQSVMNEGTSIELKLKT